MDIPINPLYTWQMTAATIFFISGFSIAAFRLLLWPNDRVRSLVAAVSMLAGLAGSIGLGVHQMKDWREEATATIERDYGLEITPGAVVALVYDDQIVTVKDSNGEEIRVKLVNDELVKTGDEVLKKNK